MLQILQFVADREFFIKKGFIKCCKSLKNVANDAQPTKQCECAVACLQSVANDAEASTKKKEKEEKLQILLSFQNVAGTVSA